MAMPSLPSSSSSAVSPSISLASSSSSKPSPGGASSSSSRFTALSRPTEWIFDPAFIRIAIHRVCEELSIFKPKGRIFTASPQLNTKKFITIITDYLQVQDQPEIFGEKDWARVCGVKVPPAPDLPLDIEEILYNQCPFFPGKTVKQKQKLVYLPATINGIPLNLSSFGEISKGYFRATTKHGYRHLSCTKDIAKIVDQPLKESCWMLITEPIPGENEEADAYPEKLQRILDAAKRAGVSYDTPTTLEATVGILTHCFKTDQNLLCPDDNPSRIQAVYCQEASHPDAPILAGRMLVGFLLSGGLAITNDDDYPSFSHGILAVRRLPVGHRFLDKENQISRAKKQQKTT